MFRSSTHCLQHWYINAYNINNSFLFLLVKKAVLWVSGLLFQTQLTLFCVSPPSCPFSLEARSWPLLLFRMLVLCTEASASKAQIVLKKKKVCYWSRAYLHCCANLCCTEKWLSYIEMCILWNTSSIMIYHKITNMLHIRTLLLTTDFIFLFLSECSCFTMLC